MPLKTTIKVSHISNLSDARYCAGMGVEMLGFRVIPGAKQYLTPEVYQDIRGWISGPLIVAELNGVSNPDQIESVIRAYAPDYFELTYEEYRTYGDLLQLPCIVSLGDNVDRFTGLAGSDRVRYLSVDESISCQEIQLAGYPVLKRVHALSSLNESLEAGCFKGFVLDGPQELRPGVTNYEQLGTILEALEED